MKNKKWVSLLVITLILTGCQSRYQAQEVLEVQDDMSVENQEKNDEEPDYGKVDKEMFKPFFEQYFSLSIEQMLILNQDPIGLNEEDSKLYSEVLNGLTESLSPYLSEPVKEKLQKGYLGNKFHLPRLLDINNYVTVGNTQVEDIEIKSARVLGENLIYEVQVTTKEQVIDSIQANKQYMWDEKIGYYRVRKETDTYTDEFGSSEYGRKELENSYLFLQETPTEHEDEIRLVHNYWVEVNLQEQLVIESIEEANPFAMQEICRQRASNNKHVTRVPYENQLSGDYAKQMKEVLLTLLSQPKDFFEYYSKILYQDYYQVEKALLGIGLEDQIVIPQLSYKNAYHRNINPYKDNIEKIAIDENKIQVSSSAFGTQKQPRAHIIVPLQALTKDNEEVYYQYEYLVGMEQGKVEFIQFNLSKPLSKEQYENLSME